MDTTYLSNYESKRITAEQFPDLIQNGDFINNALGPGAASRDIFDALVDRYEEFQDVTYCDNVQVRPLPFWDPETVRKIRGHITVDSWYFLSTIRQVAAEKVVDYRPIMTEDCTAGIMNYCTVLTLCCTPPNEQGYVNLSMANFFSKDLIMNGREQGKLRLVVAEINDQLPVVYGDNWIPMDKIDYFWEKSAPLPLFASATPSGVEQQIADFVLEKICDGDCLQVGLGGISEAIVPHLDQFKDLGCNSEMIPGGFDQLYYKGVLTNLNKPGRHHGETTATLAMGDQGMYDYCTENPGVGLYCCDYINHPTTIMQNPQVTAINTAIQIDLSGQVSSESIGYRQVSGPGGQLDFAIGAHWSKNGKFFALITSARELGDGTLSSSIVPTLDPGTTVTVPRMYADYVVTEYGVASLKGKSRQERAREMIAIAHPDCRAKLEEAALSAYWPDGADFSW